MSDAASSALGHNELRHEQVVASQSSCTSLAFPSLRSADPHHVFHNLSLLYRTPRSYIFYYFSWTVISALLAGQGWVDVLLSDNSSAPVGRGMTGGPGGEVEVEEKRA